MNTHTNNLVPLSTPVLLPFLGRIKAGLPTNDAYEDDPVFLDQYLVKHPGYTFLLRVSGDSMIDEGIHTGDLVILDKKREPRNKDIVAALIDNEWTLKYFHQEEGKVYLTAANAKYPPLYPKESLNIGGVVVSVIKKYY
jgi:SOS regulatory protein LexA